MDGLKTLSEINQTQKDSMLSLYVEAEKKNDLNEEIVIIGG